MAASLHNERQKREVFRPLLWVMVNREGRVPGRAKIVGLGGSLSPRSNSLAALKVALGAAAEEGAETEVFDVRAMNLPMFRRGMDPVPQAALALCRGRGRRTGDDLEQSHVSRHGERGFQERPRLADLLRDSEPPFLTDKVIGLISTAGGVQGLQAINTMEFVVRALRGMAVPMVAPVARAYQAFDESGRTTDEAIERLNEGNPSATHFR